MFLINVFFTLSGVEHFVVMKWNLLHAKLSMHLSKYLFRQSQKYLIRQCQTKISRYEIYRSHLIVVCNMMTHRKIEKSH